MDVDPIPEDVRQYLRGHFRDVKDEPSQGDYYVFTVRLDSGDRREIRVHRNVFVFSEMIPAYLRDNDLAGQLRQGNVEIAEPLSAMDLRVF